MDDTMVLILAAVALIAVGLPMFIVIRMGNRMRAKLMAELPAAPAEAVVSQAEPHLTDAAWADLLRHERHAWLNHMQVISGWLQMERPAKAQEYIAKVLDGVDGWGHVLRRATPPLVGVLFGLQLVADRVGVALRLELPEGVWLPDLAPRQAAALRELVAQVLDKLAPVAGEKAVELRLGSTADGGGVTLRMAASVPWPDLTGIVAGDPHVQLAAVPDGWLVTVLPVAAQAGSGPVDGSQTVAVETKEAG